MEFKRLKKLPDSASMRRPNLTYRRLFEEIRAAAGDWIEVNPDDVRGNTPPEKTETLQIAAWYRKIVVKVAHDADKLYVRLAARDEVAHG